MYQCITIVYNVYPKYMYYSSGISGPGQATEYTHPKSLKEICIMCHACIYTLACNIYLNLKYAHKIFTCILYNLYSITLGSQAKLSILHEMYQIQLLISLSNTTSEGKRYFEVLAPYI